MKHVMGITPTDKAATHLLSLKYPDLYRDAKS